jgi:endonuclease/exonuclease/phosphatase family metal-dependent hydrolase
LGEPKGNRLRLTLVSYNIHSGIGTDGRFDLERTARVIRGLEPDLVALQEVGDHREAAPIEEPSAYLAEMLGMQMAFGPNVVRGQLRYGNAIMSRLPITDSRNYDLSVPGREPRGALRCDIDLGAQKALHLFSVHLGLSGAERRAQEALLLSADILRDTARSYPAIVCGDFNYWREGPVDALVRSSMQDVAHLISEGGGRGRTYPSRFPLFRLDRIFVDKAIRPVALKVCRTPLARRASDHLPLSFRFDAPIEVPAKETAPVRIVDARVLS